MVSERACSLDAWLLQALFAACHEDGDTAYVHEIGELVNKLLERNGELVRLEDRGVGNLLRRNGFTTVRLGNRGRGLHLLHDVLRDIHARAYQLGVLSSQQLRSGCAHCQPLQADSRQPPQ